MRPPWAGLGVDENDDDNVDEKVNGWEGFSFFFILSFINATVFVWKLICENKESEISTNV